MPPWALSATSVKLSSTLLWIRSGPLNSKILNQVCTRFDPASLQMDYASTKTGPGSLAKEAVRFGVLLGRIDLKWNEVTMIIIPETYIHDTGLT